MKKLILYCLLATVLLWAACYAQVGAAGIENDKAAIRAVIAKETEAYYRQDFETWKSTYINESWFRYYGYWEGYPEKVRYFNGFDSLRNFKQKQFKANKTLWVGSIAHLVFHYLPQPDSSSLAQQ